MNGVRRTRLRLGRVEDVYQSRVVTIAAAARLEEVAYRMRGQDVSALVVTDAGRALGILTERDLVRALADRADLASTRAAVYLTPSPTTTTPDADLHEVAATMLARQVRHLPVVDGGEVIGMVSARDLLEAEALPHP